MTSISSPTIPISKDAVVLYDETFLYVRNSQLRQHQNTQEPGEKYAVKKTKMVKSYCGSSCSREALGSSRNWYHGSWVVRLKRFKCGEWIYSLDIHCPGPCKYAIIKLKSVQKVSAAKPPDKLDKLEACVGNWFVCLCHVTGAARCQRRVVGWWVICIGKISIKPLQQLPEIEQLWQPSKSINMLMAKIIYHALSQTLCGSEALRQPSWHGNVIDGVYPSKRWMARTNSLVQFTLSYTLANLTLGIQWSMRSMQDDPLTSSLHPDPDKSRDLQRRKIKDMILEVQTSRLLRDLGGKDNWQ